MKHFIFILLALAAFSSFAQNPPTLSEQYADVVLKSGLYNGHRAIRQERIEGFWKNIQDTLAMERRKLDEANAKAISAAQEAIQTRVVADTEKREAAADVSPENKVSFLGLVSLDKTVYNLLVWGIICLLILSLLFAIAKARIAMREADHRINLYEELNEEFRVHKSKANEKEIRLARELQTERNKVDELMGR